jgi:hypothetical protein
MCTYSMIWPGKPFLAVHCLPVVKRRMSGKLFAASSCYRLSPHAVTTLVLVCQPSPRTVLGALVARSAVFQSLSQQAGGSGARPLDKVDLEQSSVAVGGW